MSSRVWRKTEHPVLSKKNGGRHALHWSKRRSPPQNPYDWGWRRTTVEDWMITVSLHEYGWKR